jgi:hypothetical protein
MVYLTFYKTIFPLDTILLHIYSVHKWFFLFWYFITQSLFKVLFRNTNRVTDQLNKFQFGPRLEPAVHSAR